MCVCVGAMLRIALETAERQAAPVEACFCSRTMAGARRLARQSAKVGLVLPASRL